MKGRARNKIFHIDKLANLDLALPAFSPGIRNALGPQGRFFLRIHLDDPVPSDHLLGLGKWPVHHQLFPSRELDPSPLGAGLDPGKLHQNPGPSKFLGIISDGGKQFLTGLLARFTIPAGFDDHHELHPESPFVAGLPISCLSESAAGILAKLQATPEFPSPAESPRFPSVPPECARRSRLPHPGSWHRSRNIHPVVRVSWRMARRS